MESIILGVFGLIIGGAVLTGAVAVLFLAYWEKKRKRSIC
jgi:hypothetical protein